MNQEKSDQDLKEEPISKPLPDLPPAVNIFVLFCFS
jgi:hypothetical protein